MGGRGGSSGLSVNGKSGWKKVANNLPDLTGSEKQISWAENIRKEMIERFEKQLTKESSESLYAYDVWQSDVLKQLMGSPKYAGMEDRVLKELKDKGTPAVVYEGRKVVKEDYTKFNLEMKKQSEKAFEEILKTQTSARYWIDRRR